jgi:hypothetical protein
MASTDEILGWLVMTNPSQFASRDAGVTNVVRRRDQPVVA